jgi:hypothetical protein
MSDEQTILTEGEVQVTSARFIASGQTYALRNITSVKAQRRGGVWGGGIFLFIAVSALAGSLASKSGEGTPGAIIIGLCFGVIGAYWLWRNLTGRIIVVSTAAGEQPAFATQDRALAQRVLQALNDAIARR